MATLAPGHRGGRTTAKAHWKKWERWWARNGATTAVMSLTAGILGGLAAAFITADRDDARLLTEQRLALYGEFTAAADGLQHSLEDVRRNYPSAGGPSDLPPSLPARSLDELQGSLEDVETLLGRIRMLSGPETNEAGEFLRDDLRDGLELYVMAADCSEDAMSWSVCPGLPDPAPAGVPSPQASPEELNGNFDSIARDRPNFLDMARAELKVPA